MSSKTTAAFFGAALRPRLALVAGLQVAAGSQGSDSDAARTMAVLGWCAAFVDTVRLAVAGGLKGDGSGFRAVDADGRTGRRVKGERVRLLARCGYLARHASGLVVATEDGHEALRLAEAAGPGVLLDEADVMASVRKARRARQWDSHAGQDAHALPVLLGGGEERRRLAVARKGAERAAVEAEKTRKHTETLMRRARIRARREARREAAREVERTAPRRCCRGVWPLDWRCGECRELAARGIQDFPALPPGGSDSRTQQDHDNDTEGHTDMAGKRRIAVKRITGVLWHATTRGQVYTIVKEDGREWPWIVVSPDGERIAHPSVINNEPFTGAIRDIVRAHADGKPVPGLPADSEQAADAVATPEEAVGESAEGSDVDEAADVPAYNTPTPARAVALDVLETKWVAECDRHGPVSMALDKYGDPVADVSAAYVYTSRDEADAAARLHLDRHAAQDADIMTPDDIDAAQSLNFSRDQWRTLGWMREGKVRETADGFTAFDVSPDKADVSAKINKQRVPCLWLAGFVKVYVVAPGVRAFDLTDEGEAAFRLWSQAVRIGAVTEPEKDAKHTAVKNGPYRWLSAGDTWPGEAKAAQAAADAEAKAEAEAAALRKAEEECAALKAATPTDDELAVIDALGREDLDENAAAVLSAAYIGHVITRYRPGATSVRLDEGSNDDERHVSRTYNVNGVEKPITTEADDTLSAIPANLTDATADTWHALCTSVDERYGVYWLDLQAAMDAGRAALAADEESESQESPELWASREFVQTAEPGTDAEVIEWAGAGLLWQRGDGFGHAGRRVPAARVAPLIEAGTLYRSADGRVYPVKDAKAVTAAPVMVGGCCSCGAAVEFPGAKAAPPAPTTGAAG